MLISAQRIDEVEPGDLQEHKKEQSLLNELPQIKHIAQRLAATLPANVEQSDLISEGVFGLMDAARRYDPSRGAKFKTYAELRIRGAMLDSLRTLDWVSRSVRKKSKKLEMVAKELEQRFGRPASEKEVADELGVSLQKYYLLVEKLRRVTLWSLENTRDEARLKQVHEWQQTGPFFHIQHGEVRQILAEAVERLPTRERLVVSLYYYDEHTMKEIGMVLGVNETRASQYHSRAKARLLTHLRRRRLDRESC